MTKPKGRVAPRIDVSVLEENLVEQLTSGVVTEALLTDAELPALQSDRGQAVRFDRCLLRSVTLSDPKARGLRMRDVRIESSQLANVDLTGASLERAELVSTRLTGATLAEGQLKSVLFEECKLDFVLWRMAKLETCVFERCNLVEADFYSADLAGVVFRECDLSRADLSHTNLAGADLRGCRLDGMKGKPSNTDGLIVSPDQAVLLITLFGIRVEW